MQHLVIIPGISDSTKKLTLITKNWDKTYNIKPHIVKFGWQGNDKNLNSRLKIIGKYIDNLLEEGKEVSLLGTSAGGSAVINLFYPRTDKIKKVITICGRVRDPNVRKMWNHKPQDLGVYEESVKLSEKNLKKLDPQDKERILTSDLIMMRWFQSKP